jgi:hypothetical protein
MQGGGGHNKENEQPNQHISAMMITTGAPTPIGDSHHGHHHHPYTAMSSGLGSNQENYHFHPPASAKAPQIASGNIHAPRHSFTKRSFGRDLMNMQQNTSANQQMYMAQNNESGKVHLFNMQNKVSH